VEELEGVDPLRLLVAETDEGPVAVALLDVLRPEQRVAEEVPGRELAEAHDLLRALLLRVAREHQQRPPVNEADLGDLDLSEGRRLGDRLQQLPVAQVGAAGVRQDAVAEP
jgi:hypothetical protein